VLLWQWAGLAGLVGCQGGDFDEVVGEDAVSAPGSGAGEGGQAGAVPAVAVFEVADAAFASGAPFDESAEGWALFGLPAVGAGGAFTGDGDVADAEIG
jgi:hypothetical protein